MMSAHVRRWTCLLIAVGGCATPKAAPPAPELTLLASRVLGSPLTAAVPATRPTVGDLIGIGVTWYAVASVPDAGLLPLDAVATLTSAPLGGGAVLPSGRETRSARFAGGLAARQWLAAAMTARTPAVDLGHLQASVAEGATVRFASQTAAPKQSAEIAISRGASAASPARPVATPSTAAPTTASTTSPATAPPADATFAITIDTATTRPSDLPGAETAYLEHQPLAAGTPYVLVLPWHGPGPWTAVAAYVEVQSTFATDPAEVAAWQRLTRNGGGSSTAPATRPDELIDLRRALDALAGGGDPRTALLYLAGATDARLAADVALVADANLIDKLRDAVKQTPAVSTAAVGWALDRTALLTLADAAGKAPLRAEMVAVLAVHTGEVGRHPDALAEITAAVGNTADLQARLVGENFIALEDNAASARVRAFDWLKTRGRAPADYDPLGPPRDRRAAINRAIAAPGATP